MKKGSVRNLYQDDRGKWWYAKQVKRERPWVALNTRDELEAIRRIRDIALNPILRDAGQGLKAEAKQFVAYKLAHREYSRNSAENKILLLDRFADAFPKATAATATTSQCTQFYAALCSQVSESTAEGYMMTLRSFFGWARDVKRWRFDNPVAAVKLAQAEHGIRKRFADKPLKNRLIRKATDDDLRFILSCGFDTGLRRDEISEARVDWFASDSCHVQRSTGKRLRPGEREWRPKYNKERVIPLTMPFRKFLRGYLKGKDPLDFALQSDVPHGTWRYRYDFRRPFADYMKAQEQSWITPHVMRHSFASILKTHGESIAKIAEWLGDSERVTERTYAHLKPDDRGIHVLS